MSSYEPTGTEKTREERSEDPRFAHHKFLASVAGEDVRFLLEKDRKYGASWKRSGGRSAWFMLVRKMDRLQEIMRAPAPPEGFDLDEAVCRAQNMARIAPGPPPSMDTLDRNLVDVSYLAHCYAADNIFAKIRQGEYENERSGEDGTALAEVRDLRRYLTLVEAEMISRGVVPVPDVAAAFAEETDRASEAARSERDALVAALHEVGIRGWWNGAEWKLRWISDNSEVGFSREGWQSRTTRTDKVGAVERTVSVETRGDVVVRLEDGLDYVPPLWPYVTSPDKYQGSSSSSWQPTMRTYYNVNRAAVGRDFAEDLPTLRRELNWKEYCDLPAWYRGMYEWIEGEVKFRLLRAFWDWPGVT